MTKAPHTVKLTGPMGLSLLLHAIAFAALIFTRAPESNYTPVQFRAKLDAAPAGPRDIGVVTKTPPVETKEAPPAASPTRTETPKVQKVPQTTKVPTKVLPTPVRSTVTPDPANAKASAADADNKVADTKAAPPTAGGGKVGDKGADAVTALFGGLDFPDPSYLNNIINQISRYFVPLENSAFVAQFSFELNRDGCLTSVRLVKGSVSADFNTEAEGAIRKAGARCGFRPLPAAWTDDVLRVRFNFDPRIIK
jgi:hypothetical protein